MSCKLLAGNAKQVINELSRKSRVQGLSSFISADKKAGLWVVFWSLGPKTVGMDMEIINMENNKEARMATCSQFLNERKRHAIRVLSV